MADLDDFFAKKDKRKGKKGAKFTTADEIAKKLDEPKKAERTRERNSDDENPTNTAQDGGDEWKEFQEEEKKDYSGLKIGNLNINADGSNENATDAGQEQDENGTSNADGPRGAPGPWKKIAQEPAKEAVKTSATTTGQVTSGKYVSPSVLRLQQQQQVKLSTSRAKAQAPDINNQDFFPSLSGGAPAKVRTDASFEEVRPSKAGWRVDSKTDAQAPKLTLGNRFNTLSSDS